MATICLATSSHIRNNDKLSPKKKAQLNLKCPLSINGDCVIVPRQWTCVFCGSTLEHGFDHMFYCTCGQGPANSYSFKCCDLTHGDEFVKFDKAQLDLLLPPIEVEQSPPIAHFGPKESPLKVYDDCLNILILGATGVGKSTFINAFANYLTFDNLDDALNGEMQSLIYSRFFTSTEDDEEKEIVVGVPDDQESTTNGNVGSSCTQSCRAYTFSIDENKTIRLIDTPGIGDTRGFDQDVKNMKDIISCISKYTMLNGICILFKPNEERLTPSLKYYLIELLTHLHKDAVNNITFCFTNSRSTMFRVGGTRGLLKTLLADLQQTSTIQLNKDTMYYFDSEAFKFLASSKRGIKFSNGEKNLYETSWTQSTSEAGRLIHHISNLSPHSTEKTVSLNSVRDMLTTIEMPLSEMSSVIDRNLEATQKQKQDLFNYREGIMGKFGQLVIKETIPEVVPLGHLRTICKRIQCKGKLCHERCESNETGFKIIDNIIGLRLCQAFTGITGKCKLCGCSIKYHTRVITEIREVIHERIDQDVAKAIDEKKGAEAIELVKLQVLEKREATLKKEMEQTVKAAALFASFLAQNSIVVYHRATEDYLEDQIEMKKKLSDLDPMKKQTLERLESSLESYRNQVKTYEDRHQHNNDNKSGLITVEDVTNMLQKLFTLDENGERLKKIMDTVTEGYKLIIQRDEVRHIVRTQQPVIPSSVKGGLFARIRESRLFANAKALTIPRFT